MPPSHLQIAIDGPAASGKTTVARMLAQRLGILYLDTGAMYRALAALALRTRSDADNEAALVYLCQTQGIEIRLDPQSPMGFRVFAGGAEIDEATLQGNAVTAVVSTVAAHEHVREAMVREQRRIASGNSVVMAGRDIGTVVLPDARVKIFLTASLAARVERRLAQLQYAGVDVSAHRLTQEIEERDQLDQTRHASPLVVAPDAHILDSSDLAVEAVVEEICNLVARVAA